MSITMNKQKFWIIGLALLAAVIFVPQAADAQATIVPFELCATSGSAEILVGTTVPIWGYTLGNCSGTPVAGLPGPTLVVDEGDVVQVTLYNNLATETTGLWFPGQAMQPDRVGVAPGSNFTYSFTASQPGTFLYEAAPLANAHHQVAMGMYGALIVRPVDGLGLPINQAYGDAATAFDIEAQLLLSEIDPDLNSSAIPADFDMRDYTPKYWLINGKAYPATPDINPLAGNKLLLRYLNAGLQPHTVNLLGLDQTLLGVDGSPLPYTRRVVANTIAPGETVDSLISMPATAPAGGSRYALYDGSFLTHNNAAAGFGGMMLYINLSDGTPPTTGPATSNVTIADDQGHNPTDGLRDVTLSATINAAFPATVTAAEYFVDTIGMDGMGLTMTADDGTFDSQIENVSVTIPAASIAALGSGDHIFYVHGQDSTTTWGSLNFVVLRLDMDGPNTTGLVLLPNPTGGGVTVDIQATGNDRTTGNGNIINAEYWIDAGPALPMSVNVTSPIASLDATIDMATMSGLLEGEHTVFVRSQDDLAWWGAPAMAPLKVDHSGPDAVMALIYNPASPNVPATVRVNATFTDPMTTSGLLPAVNTRIFKAEGFICKAGVCAPPIVDGEGFPMTPRDGLFNTTTEAAYADIPMATIAWLGSGTHTIYVHAQDGSGNWGVMVSATFTVP